jgi:hypothetical protein
MHAVSLLENPIYKTRNDVLFCAGGVILKVADISNAFH